MNIFVLDLHPERAAEYMCDRHIPKMVLETAQLLCSPFSLGVAPYKRTHFNHPCSKWTRETHQNYMWLVHHGKALGFEFELRFKKVHKSSAIILWAEQHEHLLNLPISHRTSFAQAMPEVYKDPQDTVAAYRAYYMGDKKRFAKWSKSRKTPDWYNL